MRPLTQAEDVGRDGDSKTLHEKGSKDLQWEVLQILYNHKLKVDSLGLLKSYTLYAQEHTLKLA